MSFRLKMGKLLKWFHCQHNIWHKNCCDRENLVTCHIGPFQVNGEQFFRTKICHFYHYKTTAALYQRCLKLPTQSLDEMYAQEAMHKSSPSVRFSVCKPYLKTSGISITDIKKCVITYKIFEQLQTFPPWIDQKGCFQQK